MIPAILISPWFQPGVDSTIYSHATIPGTLIEALSLPGSFLTKRDKNAAKLTAYLVDDGTRRWRNATPDVTVPVQPQPMDAMQREVLAGSVHLDPHPAARSELRTRDIQDPEQAKQFIRTQVAKHLEHYFASNGRPQVGSNMTAANQLPAATISAARIAELQGSKKSSASKAHERGGRPAKRTKKARGRPRSG